MQATEARTILKIELFYPPYAFMYPPLYVHPLSETERTALEQELRSNDAFTLRRCQILLASARQTKPKKIATDIG